MTDARPSPKRTAYLEHLAGNGWNISATARHFNKKRATVYNMVKDYRPVKPAMSDGKVRAATVESRDLPKGKAVKRYLVTSVQSNTKVWEPWWNTLQVLKEHWDAELLVSQFTYNTSAYGKKAVKPGTFKNNPDQVGGGLWFDERVEPYACNTRVRLAPGLVFCGELNILPTAARPLSAMSAYTGRDSMIVPHAKIAMESVAAMPDEAAKLMYTTGCVNKRNYIQKKEGQKAEFYHTYGALVVEVDSEGSWWVRQIIADEKGDAQDLDLKVVDGKITTGNRVEAINWGDTHRAQADPVNDEVQYGEGGMLDTLHPKVQFQNDTLDFLTRNDHIFKKGLWHELFRAFCKGFDSVEDEIRETGRFLYETSFRPWCKTVVVNSNHDEFLARWLQHQDYRRDPINAIFFLKAQLHAYKTYKKDPDADPQLFRWAVERMFGRNDNVSFLQADESYVVCKGRRGGIQCGEHGHEGPDGQWGSPATFARLGRRFNIGHVHKAGIYDDVYVAGLSGKKRQIYARGMSSVTASHIITYENSNRAIVTVWRGKWRA